MAAVDVVEVLPSAMVVRRQGRKLWEPLGVRMVVEVQEDIQRQT